MLISSKPKLTGNNVLLYLINQAEILSNEKKKTQRVDDCYNLHLKLTGQRVETRLYNGLYLL